MVEATQAYHPKVLTAICAIAERYAREEVKRQVRARGEKISADITRMARALLNEL